MQKERVALHSVLPSARKAIEDIETKKRAIEVQLAATQEELRQDGDAPTAAHLSVAGE